MIRSSFMSVLTMLIMSSISFSQELSFPERMAKLEAAQKAHTDGLAVLKQTIQQQSSDINRLETAIDSLTAAVEALKTTTVNPTVESPPKVTLPAGSPVVPGAAPDVPRTVQWANPGMSMQMPQATFFPQQPSYSMSSMAMSSYGMSSMRSMSGGCANGSCGSSGRVGLFRRR